MAQDSVAKSAELRSSCTLRTIRIFILRNFNTEVSCSRTAKLCVGSGQREARENPIRCDTRNFRYAHAVSLKALFQKQSGFYETEDFLQLFHRITGSIFIHAKKEGSTTISIKYLYFFSLRNNFGYSKIYRVFYSLFIHAAWRDSAEIKMFRDDRKEADRTNLLIARLIVKRGAENQACGYRTCSNI